jgi:membrane-associated phospholipid phosphatase
VLYALDPPYNLCPSLHVSIAVLAAMSMSRALGRRAPLSSLAAAVVAVSTCLVKQHFLIDVFAGAALAALIGGITLQTHGGFHRDRGSGAGRAGESLRRVK